MHFKWATQTEKSYRHHHHQLFEYVISKADSLDFTGFDLNRFLLFCILVICSYQGIAEMETETFSESFQMS